MVATARRCAGILCAAYVDDLPVIDTAECAPSARIGLQHTLSLAEYEQSPGKAFGPSPYIPLLGVSVSFAQTADTGVVRMEPTTTTHQRIMDALNRALETLYLSPAQASTLRGLLGWAATATFGRLGRIGAHQLKLQQYGTSSDVSEALESALRFLIRLHSTRVPRDVQIFGRSRPSILIYSDASFEPGSGIPPRLGWICIDPESGTITAATHDLRQCIVNTWLPGPSTPTLQSPWPSWQPSGTTMLSFATVT